MMRIFSRSSNEGESPHAASPPTPIPPAPPSISTGPARPIRFVYTDEKGKFQIDPEAVALLQLILEPVGVVSVCGRARQGKSFILNQLLGKSSGFQVASTHRPCTKGLWLWSTPLRRTALDGTVYNLLLLDSEGIDAYDQTGTYSTQIFSLAVLLSSMFIYNQMGGIDEAALDRLSLVTEMSKRIRLRATSGRNTASELGQFSPTFVWLLRDFYLDLVEDNYRITPRDYLEIALRPVQGGGKDIASKNMIREAIREAKNMIREAIRALFPDRECFTLVRPLSNENDLQRLDQIALAKLRPEFRAGLDAFTRFVFERTRPKQVGSVVMTGPILARITQLFLDALNKGAVPTITSSWQSVEETECQRAYELGTEIYMSSFDRSRPPDEDVLREANEDAAQKSMDTFNSNAVAAGPVREKYEKRLKSFIKKAFEDIKKDAFREAYKQCTSTIENMENELRIVCCSPDAKIDSVLEVLDGILSNYEATCHGPEKWRREVEFLQQSLEGPLLDFIKRQVDRVNTEKTSLALKYRSIEDKLDLLNKQLEASEKHKSEYLNLYENNTNDKKRLAEEYMSHIAGWQKKCSVLEEKISNISRTLDTAMQESIDWKRKYDLVLSKQRSAEEQANAEVTMLRSRCSAYEAKLAASQEKAQSVMEEIEEWKRQREAAVQDAKLARERATALQERANYQIQSRENDLRAEFSNALAEKENEIKEKATKIEKSNKHITILSLELKGAESKLEDYGVETSSLELQITELGEKLESLSAAALSAESKARILEQEKIHLEQKYKAQFDQFEGLQERCKIAEELAKRATEMADKARAEAASAQKDKRDLQRVAMERLAMIERVERNAETLERQKADLVNDMEKYKAAEREARLKVEMLEGRLSEREKEIDSLLQSNNNQRKNTVQVLESLLESERAAHAEANNRAESLSVKLQVTQGKLDELSHELNALRFGDKTTLDSRLRTASHAKRGRTDDFEMGVDLVQDTDTNEKATRANKRSKSTTSPLKFNCPEDGGSVFRGDELDSQQTNSEDYNKFTVSKLKQVLTQKNYGDQLLQLKNPNKKDLIALYEKCVLKNS